jgi:hypothetical protein
VQGGAATASDTRAALAQNAVQRIDALDRLQAVQAPALHPAVIAAPAAFSCAQVPAVSAPAADHTRSTFQHNAP